MTNLEKLETDIRGKLPRLFEPTKGCAFYFIGSIYTIDHIDEYNVFASKDHKEHTVIIREKFNSRSCIYGHNIMLNDVLEWLGIIWGRFAIESDGTLIKIHDDEEYECLALEWDLSKSNLKDQSSDLINYLAGLI